MNIQKTVSIVAAIAINVAVLAWFHAWSAGVAASAAAAHGQTSTIVTLPVISVHPSAAQLRQLHESGHAPQPATPDQASLGGGGNSAACLVMPYYSFASQCDATVSS